MYSKELIESNELSVIRECDDFGVSEEIECQAIQCYDKAIRRGAHPCDAFDSVYQMIEKYASE